MFKQFIVNSKIYINGSQSNILRVNFIQVKYKISNIIILKHVFFNSCTLDEGVFCVSTFNFGIIAENISYYCDAFVTVQTVVFKRWLSSTLFKTIYASVQVCHWYLSFQIYSFLHSFLLLKAPNLYFVWIIYLTSLVNAHLISLYIIATYSFRWAHIS